jgi:nicotinamidase-related amidase
MDVLLVVDMQVGSRAGLPKHDLPGVVQRISRLAAALRAHSGKVIWIQHCGSGEFARGQRGWALLPEMDCNAAEIVVEKALNDPFARTSLPDTLLELNADGFLCPCHRSLLRLSLPPREPLLVTRTH